MNEFMKTLKIGGGAAHFCCSALAVLFAFCIAAPARSSAAEYAYTARSDVSLGDGKIEILHDSSGAITNLTMTPSSGETLTLTGDTLSFADGANIVLGPDGTNSIAAPVSAAGSLNIPTGDMLTWTTSSRGLKSKSYETLFENMDLDDIEPAFATPVSYFANSGDTAYPFFVTRGVYSGGTKYMKFELHCYNNGKTSWYGN